jgi:dCTP diphosphatase
MGMNKAPKPIKSGTRDSLSDLAQRIEAFAQARAWDQYHTPKNLAMALSVEVAELVEHFQWLTPQQSLSLPARDKKKVALEIADVLIYLTRLADVLDVDAMAAALRKMKINALRYPIAKARGNAKKYTALR